MRFKVKKDPQDGDTKIETFFAIFPVTVDAECRWLEKVTVKIRYCHNWADNGWTYVEFLK